MQTPFTSAQFYDVFRQYNDDVWPLQFVLEALGVAAVALLAYARPWRDAAIGVILAFLWLWMGAVYHLLYFMRINEAALYFGIAFLGAATVFLLNGVYGARLSFEIPSGPRRYLGGGLLAYALAVYPVLSLLLGRYPEVPTFGLPCPTTIFTFGVLLWSGAPVPLRLVIIPALWSVLGISAALSFGIVEDFGLLVAGVAGTALIVARKVMERRVRPSFAGVDT